jgi:hypothetical protein
VPTQVNSASLHPDKTIFICGGEDLKMYKFDYTTGTEIGKVQYKGQPGCKFYILKLLIECSLWIMQCIWLLLLRASFLFYMSLWSKTL